jgi:hypothetical protein
MTLGLVVPTERLKRCRCLSLCHPDRTRISYYAAPPKTTYAAFIEESRMKFANATKPDRKSGGSGGICGSLNQHLIRMEVSPSPLSSRLPRRAVGPNPGFPTTRRHQ